MSGTELLAVILVGGQGLAAIDLLAGVRRIGPGRALAAALPVGLVVHAALALPLRLAGVPVSLGSAAVQASLLALAAVAAARFRRSPGPASSAVRWRTGEKAVAAAIVAVLCLVALTAAFEPPVEWDLLAIWGLKAKALGVAGDGFQRLRDPAFAYSHSDYPLAWPLALALEPAFLARAPHGGSGLLGAAMLAAAAGLVATMLGPWGRRAALAGAGLWVLLPLAGAQAVRGLADLPLATLLLLAAGLLTEWTVERDRAALVLGALATAGLVIVKQEGMALAVAVAGVVLWRSGTGARWRPALAFGAAFLVVDLPWLLVRSTLPAGAANSLADMTPARAIAGFARLPELLAALPVYLGAPGDWGALWLLSALALAALAVRRERPPRAASLALMLIAPLPLYVLALSAVAWDPARLAEVTLARLALHFAPLATVVSIAVAADHGAFGRDPTAARSVARE